MGTHDRLCPPAEASTGPRSAAQECAGISTMPRCGESVCGPPPLQLQRCDCSLRLLSPLVNLGVAFDGRDINFSEALRACLCANGL
jgi:hypothetical protein